MYCYRLLTDSTASSGQVSGTEQVGFTSGRCRQVLSAVSVVAGSGRGPFGGTLSACAEGSEENHETPQLVESLKQER